MISNLYSTTTTTWTLPLLWTVGGEIICVEKYEQIWKENLYIQFMIHSEFRNQKNYLKYITLKKNMKSKK